jgi:hypothetical protein
MAVESGNDVPTPESRDEAVLYNAVTIQPRPDGLITAHLVEHPQLVGAGRSNEEAVGTLALTHLDEFIAAVERHRPHEQKVGIDLTDEENKKKVGSFLRGEITAKEAGPGFGYGSEGRPVITISRKILLDALPGADAKPEDKDPDAQ